VVEAKNEFSNLSIFYNPSQYGLLVCCSKWQNHSNCIIASGFDKFSEGKKEDKRLYFLTCFFQALASLVSIPFDLTNLPAMMS